jgi:hypothetical protein
MPKIRQFHTSCSTALTTMLMNAKRQDGRPAFNFMGLKRLSMSFTLPDDEPNIRYLLENAKLLEELRFSVGSGLNLLAGLHILSTSARTLKILDLNVNLFSDSIPLAGL